MEKDSEEGLVKMLYNNINRCNDLQRRCYYGSDTS